MTVVKEAAPEPASNEVAQFAASMFQSLKLPANGSDRFAKFLKFVDQNPNLIATNDQNEMIVEGKRLVGSNFDHLIRNLYFLKGLYNLPVISDLSHAL